MRDYSHIPSAFDPADVTFFTNPVTVTNLQWAAWCKPRGKTMAHILCIGGGAGGGGAVTAASGTAAGGGGGGGSSGHASLLIPLHLLPDRLFIQVGAGGAGAGVGADGTAGILSYVAIAPDTTASNILAISGAAGAAGGIHAVTTAGGAGGAAGTIPVIGSMPLGGLGQNFLIAGQIGTAGGSSAVGAAQSIPVTGALTMGGTGGGGKSTNTGFAGGLITSVASSFISEYRPQISAVGANGSAGWQLLKPFFSYPGIGGGSATAAAGGFGGPGAYGAGGGGGGGGTTGGTGGKGGNGIVIIVCW